MQKVYMETTIPSYLVSRPNRDIIILSHQEITKDWWENERSKYDLYLSEYVIEEISKGDEILSQKRIDLIKGIMLLEHNNEIETLAGQYLKYLELPKNAAIDMLHIAYSVYYEMDYLLTWNCKHLANAYLKVKLVKLNNKSGYKTPEICTPEQLIMEV